MPQQPPPRNAPCPCGSGRKFKACCTGKGTRVPPAAAAPGRQYNIYSAKDPQGRDVIVKLKPTDLDAPDLTYEEARTLLRVESFLTDDEPITFAVGPTVVSILPPAIKHFVVEDDELEGRCVVLALHMGETIRIGGEMAAKVVEFIARKGYLRPPGESTPDRGPGSAEAVGWL